jgi:hypothetical protein
VAKSKDVARTLDREIIALLLRLKNKVGTTSGPTVCTANAIGWKPVGAARSQKFELKPTIQIDLGKIELNSIATMTGEGCSLTNETRAARGFCQPGETGCTGLLEIEPKFVIVVGFGICCRTMSEKVVGALRHHKLRKCETPTNSWRYPNAA